MILRITTLLLLCLTTVAIPFPNTGFDFNDIDVSTSQSKAQNDYVQFYHFDKSPFPPKFEEKELCLETFASR